jgi:hypothetical protein
VQHVSKRDIRNMETRESIGLTYDLNDICKAEIFNEEFITFRRPT